MLDHLHVLAVAGLEADGQDLAGFLLAFGHFNGLIERDGHGLFAQNVRAGAHGLAGADVVLRVVGTHGHAVGLEREQLVVVFEGGHVGQAELVQEGARLAGHDVGRADDLHVGHIQIGTNVGMGDAARADDADTQYAHGLIFLSVRYFAPLL